MQAVSSPSRSIWSNIPPRQIFHDISRRLGAIPHNVCDVISDPLRPHPLHRPMPNGHFFGFVLIRSNIVNPVSAFGRFSDDQLLSNRGFRITLFRM